MNSVDRLTSGLRHHIANTLGWQTLRTLQTAAIAPVLDGHDTLMLAPTAGGKTEAAVFPLLTAMVNQKWNDLSVLYVCPLRALLNNLHPRIDAYSQWLGRTAGLWHGDTSASARKRIRVERPDILLTTPESLEALLVSTLVTPSDFFHGLRAVIIDEVHAFAGDDRGWHLLAVLERLTRLAGRPIQRIGLSATVGNPQELLRWLQGSNASISPGTILAPDPLNSATTTVGDPADDVCLDYVGTVPNAATIVARLHHGEKRLVFCESRRRVEELALHLRGHGVNTFVSHSSLSADERRRAEQAFADARDCVIVATSTLELGIDVGDLDRVIQIDAPPTVASFLQRLGRTGRRPDTSRNTLFLATTTQALVHAAGLLTLWRRGFVEPVKPPPAPRHIAAQQILALCLQLGRVGDNTWAQWWDNLAIFDDTADEILQWLIRTEHISHDESGMLFVGPQAERRYGRRHFMDLLTVFTSAPQFAVLYGRQEIGGADPLMLITRSAGPRLLSLGGRAWKVNHIDWQRRRCYVEASDHHARSAWTGSSQPHSFELSQAQREILLGADPDVNLSQRARATLATARAQAGHRVAKGASVVEAGQELRWWTWAGGKGNATLVAAIPHLVDADERIDNHSIRLRSHTSRDDIRRAIDALEVGALPDPQITDEAVRELKFGEILPPNLATATLAARIGDHNAARYLLTEPIRWTHYHDVHPSG
ncbi:DEAD/DEAH box helicase [Actinomycetes bacterium KLBMP 9797]